MIPWINLVAKVSEPWRSLALTGPLHGYTYRAIEIFIVHVLGISMDAIAEALDQLSKQEGEIIEGEITVRDCYFRVDGRNHHQDVECRLAHYILGVEEVRDCYEIHLVDRNGGRYYYGLHSWRNFRKLKPHYSVAVPIIY